MRRPTRFWNEMPPGGYTDLFWAVWVTALSVCLLALAVAALGFVPDHPFQGDTWA